MTGGHPPTVSLTAAMLRDLNETVLELNDPAKSEEELFDCLVSRCRTLIPHSTCFVLGMDRRILMPTMYFGPWAEMAADAEAAVHPFLEDHPYFIQHCFSPVPRVDAVSGHVSRRQWHSTGLFQDVFKKSGFEDQIAASHPFNERLGVSLIFHRDGWGFKQEESALLALLLPHVVQALRTRAMTRRLEAIAGMPGDRFAPGALQVVADSRGHVIDASDELALRQLWERFREPAEDAVSRLPGPVCRWLRETLDRHFRGDESSLRVRLSGDLQAPGGERFHLRLLPGAPNGMHVLACEPLGDPEAIAISKLESLGLSPRRAQVLHWVAEGKSNGEIAIILGISLQTVKNHLVAIFDLLLVENRHAAVLAARKVLRG